MPSLLRRPERPRRRFSSTVSEAKMWRPSGTSATPARATSSGAPAQRRAVAAGSRRAAKRDEPHDRVQRRSTCPAPFGPIRPTISPGSRRRLRLAHRGHGAVADLERAELEQRAQPSPLSHRPGAEVGGRDVEVRAGSRRASLTASVRPRSRTWMRSQTSMISATLWSISSTPAPKSSRTERTTAAKAGISASWSPAAGSSISTKRGPQRQRAGDAEPALVAVRQHRRRVVCARPRARAAEQLVGARRRASRGEAPPPSAATSTFSRTRQPAEQPAVLEGARETGAAAAVGRPARDVRLRRARCGRATGGRSR